MSIMSDIRNRQRDLELDAFDIVVVIGVGGIGSWVALNLGLSGIVKNLILIDPDVVESSNLNRTPFRLADIGAPKVDAMKYLILERRAIDVTIFMEKTSKKINRMVRKIITENSRGMCAIIDCRDEIFTDMYDVPVQYYYKIGYDGLDITIDGDPKSTVVMGEGNGYEVTPSFICPAQFAANLVVSDLLVDRYNPSNEDISYPVNEGGKLKGIITFSMLNIFDLISKGSE